MLRRGETNEERLLSHIRVVGVHGHWRWIGTFVNGGYGQAKIRGRKVMAHRAVYEALIGPIPEGFTLDHLCRYRWCCHPNHNEPVTLRVNLLRGTGFPAVNHEKQACVNGHPFTTDNTYRPPGTKRRQCRVCLRIASQRYRNEKEE